MTCSLILRTARVLSKWYGNRQAGCRARSSLAPHAPGESATNSRNTIKVARLVMDSPRAIHRRAVRMVIPNRRTRRLPSTPSLAKCGAVIGTMTAAGSVAEVAAVWVACWLRARAALLPVR